MEVVFDSFFLILEKNGRKLNFWWKNGEEWFYVYLRCKVIENNNLF